MRSLKFRAWDEEAKHMAYSDQNEWGYDFGFENKEGILKCSVNTSLCDDLPTADDWKDLDNIMQDIGRKDKAGKDIYEGDILQYQEAGKEPQYALVEYDEDNRKFSFVPGKKMIGWKYGMEKECEVIGNIYETPELAKRI